MPNFTEADPAHAAARAAGCPYAIGTNILRRGFLGTPPLWSPTGIFGDIYMSQDDAYPTSFMIDSDLGDFSRCPAILGNGAAITSVSTVYVICTVEAGDDFEHTASAAMIRFNNANSFAPNGAERPINVSITIANDGDFTDFDDLPSGGDVISFSWLATNAKLIAPSFLGPDGYPQRGVYDSIRYLRFEIHCANGNFLAPPEISELVVGTSRQFAHNPREPYDPFPLESGTEDHLCKNGNVGSNIEFERLARFPFRYKAHDNNPYGISEDAMFRQLLADTRGMTRNFLWVDQPSNPLFDGGRATGFWGYNPDRRMPAKYTNATATEVEFQFNELPPGQAKTEDFNAVLIGAE